MGADDARRMLRGEPPFAALRLRRVSLSLEDANGEAVVACLADVASHQWTTGLGLADAPLGNPAALDAVVDLALGRRFTAVALRECSLSPACAPALARLLGSSALKELALTGNGLLLGGAGAAAQLAAALRANSTLQRLHLDYIHLWDQPGAATILLCALINHPSVRELSLSGNQLDDQSRAAAVALVCALLASTPLRSLQLQSCNLRDEGLGLLSDALARNTHLTHLDIGYNSRSTAFLRDRLLPALHAGAASRLRQLSAGEMIASSLAAMADDAELQDEATALLAARAAADAADAGQAA
jgi:Ran GTPase-activating protein (RanGAP) involved in mRNA processing and transport